MYHEALPASDSFCRNCGALFCPSLDRAIPVPWPCITLSGHDWDYASPEDVANHLLHKQDRIWVVMGRLTF